MVKHHLPRLQGFGRQRPQVITQAIPFQLCFFRHAYGPPVGSTRGGFVVRRRPAASMSNKLLRLGATAVRTRFSHHDLLSNWRPFHSTVTVKSDGFQRTPGLNAGELGGTASESKLAKMGIVFTCTNCEARVARTFTRRSYEKGVVIVRVEEKDGCTSKKGSCLHLIADNLGWFEDNPVNVETMLATRGESVQRIVVQETSSTQPAESNDAAPKPAQTRHAVKTDDGSTVELYLSEGERPASEPPLPQ